MYVVKEDAHSRRVIGRHMDRSVARLAITQMYGHKAFRITTSPSAGVLTPKISSARSSMPRGQQVNGWYALAHQLIAAELNIANGACAPTEVTDAIAQANAVMSQTTCYPSSFTEARNHFPSCVKADAPPTAIEATL